MHSKTENMQLPKRDLEDLGLLIITYRPYFHKKIKPFFKRTYFNSWKLIFKAI